MQSVDNDFYGTASSEGAYTNGVLYRISVPLPPVFQYPILIQSNATVLLTWSAVAGQTYQPQYSTNLGSTNWLNLGNNITATNGNASASDVAPPDPLRIYRVLDLP